MLVIRQSLCIAVAAVGCAACGQASGPTSTVTESGGTSPSVTPTSAASSGPSSCPATPTGRTLGALPSPLPSPGDDLVLAASPCAATYEGIADVAGRSTLTITIGRVAEGIPYFSPTVLTGTAGETVRVHLANTTPVLHNFSIPGEDIDVDVGPGATADVVVAFPAHGWTVYICKYHAAEGQAGELCVLGSSC